MKWWDDALQRYRRTQIEKLRAINRNDINVSDEHRAEISRAASGVFGSTMIGSPNLPRDGPRKTVHGNMAHNEGRTDAA